MTQKAEAKMYQRRNEWAHEIDKTATIPRCIPSLSYGDRFIARRCCLPDNKRNEKFTVVEKIKDVLNSHKYTPNWRQNCFTLRLNNSLGIEMRRILTLTDPVLRATLPLRCKISGGIEGMSDDQGRPPGYDWLCHPRRKPLAFTEGTHDMPDMIVYLDRNVIDWSVQGDIATSFSTGIIIWKREEDTTPMYNVKCPRSISYSPSGNLLAVGCMIDLFPVLELWDLYKCNIRTIVLSVKLFNRKHRSVRCIEWAHCGTLIVCGTHYGTIYALKVPQLTTIVKIGNGTSIAIIRFSPTMRYMASGDVNGDVVIYKWDRAMKTCDVQMTVRSQRKLNVVFDWHPWKDSELVISTDLPASIVIINVVQREYLARYQRRDFDVAIDSVSFSKITGELVVSITKHINGSCSEIKTLVMASLDCVVDVLDIPGGARFMMWSPDGTKLATTSHDLSLTIWNFHPMQQSKYLRQINAANKRQTLETNFQQQFSLWTRIR